MKRSNPLHPYLQALQQRVLIYSAGDAGEMALRWILMNPELDYQVIGFLDEDPYLHGRRIHSVAVLGGLERLAEMLAQGEIDGLILAGVDASGEPAGRALETCRNYGVWARQLCLEFVDI